MRASPKRKRTTNRSKVTLIRWRSMCRTRGGTWTTHVSWTRPGCSPPGCPSCCQACWWWPWPCCGSPSSNRQMKGEDSWTFNSLRWPWQSRNCYPPASTSTWWFLSNLSAPLFLSSCEQPDGRTQPHISSLNQVHVTDEQLPVWQSTHHRGPTHQVPACPASPVKVSILPQFTIVMSFGGNKMYFQFQQRSLKETHLSQQPYILPSEIALVTARCFQLPITSRL